MKMLMDLIALLLVSGCCAAYVSTEYTIPPDAMRLTAADLAGWRINSQLQALLNVSAEEDAGAEQVSGIPIVLQRLLRLLRKAEERKESLESSGRLLSFNRGSFFRGLLVVWLPVSFILPTLARPYSYGRRSSGNAIGSGLISGRRGYDPLSYEFTFDANYGPLLSRLEAYFDLLRIDDPHCRRKLICEAAAVPERYQPLSQLFQRLFERSQAFARPEQYHPELKKFFTYYWANKKGRTYSASDECRREYSGCSADTDDLIRVDMLNFWQKLSRRFAIQLQDE